ncbi:MAG: triose-phosphate isomerase [Desulfobacterales bacterium]|nr:triose-phosphate isomerase [Desulfobacterales bacterium]
MMRRPLIAGNWKMHKTIAGARELAAAVAEASRKVGDRDVMVAPPCTALVAVAEVLAGSGVMLAAQNIHWQESGAFTGEISPAMLRDVGGSAAIIGHSERRHLFGENNAMINKRILGALAAGITPVLCIGETLAQREAGSTTAVLEGQLRAGLAGVDPSGATELVIAYEPVWAIGTGKTATKEQAQTVHVFIRQVVGELYEKTIAGQMRILYGGSVKPDNIDSLMSQEDIDGVLVGGAALDADSFIRIISFSTV